MNTTTKPGVLVAWSVQPNRCIHAYGLPWIARGTAKAADGCVFPVSLPFASYREAQDECSRRNGVSA